ncbi:MAG: outer membrane lipoprotein-sorting protein [Fidelibacterota bacterium]|nr:MAG: outer membrane lipoprotein-sorting protein [Candidatus Neomarinimicrobiota bacterium]
MPLGRFTTRALIIGLTFLSSSAAWLQAQVALDQHFNDQGGYPSEMSDLGYQITNLGSEEIAGHHCWKLRLDGIPEKNPPYPKMVMLVRQIDNYPLRVEYYNDLNEVIKTLSLNAIREVDGVPVEMEMTMRNHLDDTETSFNLTIDYVAPSEDLQHD